MATFYLSLSTKSDATEQVADLMKPFLFYDCMFPNGFSYILRAIVYIADLFFVPKQEEVG